MLSQIGFESANFTMAELLLDLTLFILSRSVSFVHRSPLTSHRTVVTPSGKLDAHCKPETSIHSGSPFSSSCRLCNGGVVVMATPPLRCPDGWFDELPAVGSQLMAFQLSAISYLHPACSISTDPGPDCKFQTP